MSTYIKKDGHFDEFIDDGICRFLGSNGRISVFNECGRCLINPSALPFFRTNFLNPCFHKNDQGDIWLQYKSYGYNSRWLERRRQEFRVYISLDELQVALNKFIGYPRKIISVSVVTWSGCLEIECECNEYTRKIEELEDKIQELEKEIKSKKEENDALTKFLDTKIYEAKIKLLEDICLQSEQVLEVIGK